MPRQPHTSRRTKRILLFAASIFVLGTVAGWWLQSRFAARSGPVLVSPDGTKRARLVERLGRLDRNFDVIVEDVVSGKPLMLFTSPDEGRPAGTERLAWLSGSRYLLLVGQHFYVLPDAALGNGESLYLLWDSATGRLWCNSHQQRLPAFDVEFLRSIVADPNWMP